MPTPKELEDKFWKALADDKIVMLGLHGVAEGHTRPMTAMLDTMPGPLWFFASTDGALIHQLEQGHRAVVTFTARSHELFATIHGALSVEVNGAMIDRFWNSFVAAWYEHGRDDPKIVLLRLDPEQAEIWENASSLIASLRVLMGGNVRRDYRDKVATVNLRH